MSRVDRLDLVQQVADRNERERAERLAEAERNAIEAEQKLVALERYRSEYEEQLAARGAAGVDISGVFGELHLERVHFSMVNTRSAARSLPASVLMVHLSLRV
jgi:hypothetical protein